MDYGALPPEVNSARMYAGPGSGPMMAAAAAWNNLGAELATTASAYESVISALTGEEWVGPASAAMAAATAPYLEWLNSTAVAAEHAAAQAMASAAAYEAAFAATVPPPVIAANRAQLAALVATNILGQNTPAIAATEAQYGEMWAQDAVAMYGYAGSSATAGRLHPLVSPAPTTNPAGPAGQAAAVTRAAASSAGTQTGLSQLISALPNAVHGLAAPLTASGSSSTGLLSSNGFVADLINSTANIGIWNGGYNVAGMLGNIGSWNMFAGIASGVGFATSTPKGHFPWTGVVLADAAGPAGAPAAVAGVGGAPVSAELGQAAPVGGLSVPAGWSAATPAGTGSATLAGTGWTSASEAPDVPQEAMPVGAVPAGMGSAAAAGRGGYGFGAPRYGFKPTVMPKSVYV